MQEEFTFGKFRLLPGARALYSGDERVKIGSRALEILLVLVGNAGQLVKKQELVAHVWPGVHVDDGALRVHISALRKVLGDSPEAPQYIFNVAGQGYRFVAPAQAAIIPADGGASDLAPSASPRAFAHTIGRDEIIQRVVLTLHKNHFVTITGPGGIGKTTVAQAVAAHISSEYLQGVSYVDLAPLSDPRLLPSTLASALHLRLVSDDVTGELIARLKDQRLLLLLDSCEHLLDAVAAICETIAAAASSVHLLATSREPLRATGEWVTRLPPLELPERNYSAGLKQALAAPAMMLFVERAGAADDSFTPCDNDLAAMVDICHRLDGIPLAIEFAAARIGAFGAKELLARLDNRFAVLRSGRRTAVPRHRTLRATLDWSHELLPTWEQILFRRLAAFRGNFTLDAVQKTMAAPDDSVEMLLEGIANLVAKSLLNVSSAGDETHYRLFETTRAYAVEKLVQSGDAAGLARRVGEYLNSLFQTAERDWVTLSAEQWNHRYAHVIDDVRAAMDWAYSSDGDIILGAALTASSSPLWFSLGLVAEYRIRAERALQSMGAVGADAPAVEMRLNILFASATFNSDGPVSQRKAAYERSLAIATRLDDRENQLRSLWGLAGQRYLSGDYNESLELCTRFDAIAEAWDDSAAKLVRDRIMALGLHIVGRHAEARPYAERALAHPATLVRSTHKSFQEYDSQVASRSHLARILWVQGFPDRAAALAREGVDYALSLDYPPPLCYIVAFAACPIGVWTGDIVAARRYVDVMRGPAASLSFSYWQSWRLVYDVVTELRDDIDVDELEGVLSRLEAVAKQPLYGDILATLRPELAGPQAIARATDGSAGWCGPEILRAQSLALLRQGAHHSASEATALLQRSLELSRLQGALSWELRSATVLARLHQGNRAIKAARETLMPVYERFTEGFATRDLRSAAALLAELEA